MSNVKLKVSGFLLSSRLASGAGEAGGTVNTGVSLTSLNGVSGSVPFSLTGAPAGTFISPDSCVFSRSFGSTYVPFVNLQPGTDCNTNLAITTISGDSAGTYPLNFYASTQSTPYSLTIFKVPPTPVITFPSNGASFGANQSILLTGYAQSTDPGAIGNLACNQLEFSWTAPDGTTGFSPTPTQDPVNPNLCDSSVTFSKTGTASIVLSSTDTQGTGYSTPISLNISTSAPFGFIFNAPTDAILVNPPASVSFTVQAVLTGGSPQPIQLNATVSSSSGTVPSTVSVSLSSNTVTPTGTVIVTFTDSDVDSGSYTVTIKGTGPGGATASSSAAIVIEQEH